MHTQTKVAPKNQLIEITCGLDSCPNQSGNASKLHLQDSFNNDLIIY